MIRRWSEEGLHLFIAVSAEVLLGTVFLELLPVLGSAAALEVHEEHAGHGHAAHASTLPWLAALELEPLARAGAEHGEAEEWVACACAAVLALLIVATGYRALVRRMTGARA